MNNIIICQCACGGNVISRYNGIAGFCEDCNSMYADSNHNVFSYEKKGR